MANLNEYIAYLDIVKWLQIPFFTFMGCFTLYIMNVLKGKPPFSICAFLNRLVSPPIIQTPKIIFLDMIGSSFVGASVVFPLAAPETIQQAMLAGLGLIGLLSVAGENNEIKK